MNESLSEVVAKAFTDAASEMRWGRCPLCDEPLVGRTASIPESIICYKAGTEDPDKPGNRIVQELDCPNHGCVQSPGGGITGQYLLVGGPWDGRKVYWSVVGEANILEIMVKDAAGEWERHEYRVGKVELPSRCEYVGKKV